MRAILSGVLSATHTDEQMKLPTIFQLVVKLSFAFVVANINNMLWRVYAPKQTEIFVYYYNTCIYAQQ